MPHKCLLSKIQTYGISENILSWIKGFLPNRRQRVRVQRCFSNWQNVLSGIPQGSVLGPLLFAIYINDLPSQVLNSYLFLFGNYMKLLRGIFDKDDCTLLQQDLYRTYSWTEELLVKFHPEKCKEMGVGLYDMPERVHTLGDGYTPLKISDGEKDIGVIIDCKLNFEYHIAAKINKANSLLGVIHHIFHYKDERNLGTLCKSLVRLLLECANQVWAPHLAKHIIALENVQRHMTMMIPELGEIAYEDHLRDLSYQHCHIVILEEI